MKRNMKSWLEELRKSPRKKAFPILSFPTIQLMDVSVRDLISDSDLQAKGMSLVAKRADTAASVSLMDLSVEAECFGSTISISDNEVPTVVGHIISSEEEALQLPIPPVGSGRTGIYIDAIKKAASLINDRPIFAGVIGPFSLAARLLDVTEIMVDCYDEPDMVHTVLDKATQFLIQYCKAYKDAGANGIVLAEPVAGLLSPTLAEEFSSAYVKQIVSSVQDDSFLIIYHNCGNNTVLAIDSILGTGAAAYHFGNAIQMTDILSRVSPDTIVMGNIDPAGEFRNGTPDSIKVATQKLLSDCRDFPNFVLSSGCDIPPLSPWKNIDAFFDAVSDYYKNI